MLQRFFTGCDRPKATASAVTLAIPFMLAWLLNMAMTFVLEPASAADPVGPSFTRDIKSLLSNRCLRCHGPDAVARQGGGDDGLRLDTFAGATADLNGHAAIVPGHPDKSAMIVRMTSSDPDFVMPPLPEITPAKESLPVLVTVIVAEPSATEAELDVPARARDWLLPLRLRVPLTVTN